MSVNQVTQAVPIVVFVGAFVLVATGQVALDWPVFATAVGAAVVAGVVQRRQEAVVREDREARLLEVAASQGLEPVEPSLRPGMVRSLQGAAQGDTSVALVDPDRDSPSWELWHAVLPSGSVSCRFLAVGERGGRPLRLSVERTTTRDTRDLGKRRRRTRARRSVAVATRVDVDGTVEIRPSGRAWQAIGDAVGRVFRQESHTVGLPEFDKAYGVTGDTGAVQAVLDLPTASRWSERFGDARVAVADGWLAAARTVPLDAEETASTAERLLPAVDELAERLRRA